MNLCCSIQDSLCTQQCVAASSFVCCMYIGWYFCRDRLLLNPRYRGLIQPNMSSDKLEPKAKDDWQVMVRRYDCRLAAVLSSPTVIDLTTQQLCVIGWSRSDVTWHQILDLSLYYELSASISSVLPSRGSESVNALCSYMPSVHQRSSISMHSTHWCPLWCLEE